jgi:2-polyprenyl-3-methyl-5-hydroxy-6-metoxy-1,4-benzoquinol methylase
VTTTTDTTTDTTPDTTPDTTADTTAAVEEFAGKFLGDLAAVLHAGTVVLGDKLGFYRALVEIGPTTPEALAEHTGCDPRYVREWLSAQAASEYCHYDPTDGTFHLDDAQATCLADESSPAFLVGGMAVASSVHKDEDTLTSRFRTGEGVGWHEHHHDLFSGTERFFRPAYASQLVASWVPALEGVVAKLEAGGRVADIGCGHGASTIELAKAFPLATITGFDYHEASIVTARQRAVEAGVSDRVRFEVAAGGEFGRDGDSDVTYDLVCIFDALHDMGDPVGVARHIRERLAPDGTWLLVEPRAADRLEDNLHLLGRIFYSASTLICTPASRAQPVGACLGAQAGPARLRAVMEAAGFTRFRQVVDSPTNLVLEVRP